MNVLMGSLTLGFVTMMSRPFTTARPFILPCDTTRDSPSLPCNTTRDFPPLPCYTERECPFTTARASPDTAFGLVLAVAARTRNASLGGPQPTLSPP